MHTHPTDSYTLSLHDALPIYLMQFLRPDKTFDTDSYKHGVETMILAQEIIVDNASYPTATIERNSHDYRPLDRDRKSTRLNSSHQIISYAVFCLKKKKQQHYY